MRSQLDRALYFWSLVLVFSFLAVASGWAEAAPTTNPQNNPQSPSSAYVGGVLGIATASEGVGTGLGYGADFSYYSSPYIGVGAMYRGGNHGTPKTQMGIAALLLRLADRFNLGLGIGMTGLSREPNNSKTSFTYGGRLNYDYRIGESIFTVGPEVDLFFYKPEATTITHVDVLGTFKIWLGQGHPK